MKPLFIAASVLLLAATACKKDKDESPKPVRLKSYVSPGTGTFSYTYDANGRMQTETYSGNASNPARTISFTAYDNTGRLLEYVADYDGAVSDSKAIVSYDGGRPNRVFSYFVSGGGLMGSTVIEYPSANKAVVKYYSTTGVLRYYNEYTFDAAGNMTEDKYYGSTGAHEYTTVYGNYDNQKNPNLLMPQGYYAITLSQNNYRSYAQTITSTGAVTNRTFTFEYNNQGYATKRTSSTGSITTYEYE